MGATETTFFVPYDGSALATAALERAATLGAGNIATRLRDIAVETEADVVFLGSENVATRLPCDIYLVQSRD